MAVTLKDLAIANQKYAQRTQQQTIKESLTREELFAMMGQSPVAPSLTSRPAPSGQLSAQTIEENSKKALKAQEQTAESLTKTSGDGVNSQLTGIGDTLKKQGEGIEKLVELSTSQLGALKDYAGKRTDTLGPLEKIGQFFGKIKTAITNPKDFALQTMSNTLGDVPIIGSVIKKKIEKEDEIKTLVRSGMSEEKARELQPEIRQRRIAAKRAEEELQTEVKRSGMSEKEFSRMSGSEELVNKRNTAFEQLKEIDPTVQYLDEFREGKEDKETSTRKGKREVDREDSLSKIQEHSDDQLEILKKIEENTRPSPVAGGAKARAAPPKGKEVKFSGQKYRFQGQQWVEVNEKTGKQGRIAERGIVGELNKRAGVPPPTRTPEKVAPKMGFGDKLKSISGGMVDAAKGIAAIGASLVVLSFGLKQFNGIDWESLAKVTLAVGGLVLVSKLLGDNVGSMLKGALGIAALGAALLVASEGFKTFAELDWEALAKAGVALGGLALAAAGIGAFIVPILAGAAAIAAIGGAVWLLAKGIDALASAMDRVKSPKAANKPAVGTPAEQPTTAIAAAPAGETKPISGNIQAKQTGPGQYEAVSSGITSEDIVNHPNYNKYYKESLRGRTGPDAERMAKRSARMKVERDLIKQSAAGVTPTTGTSETTATRVTSAPVATANAVYGASAENAGAAAMGGAGTTNNVVAPTTVNNTTNQVGGYKPDVRNQESSFKRMLDARYVPV